MDAASLDTETLVQKWREAVRGPAFLDEESTNAWSNHGRNTVLELSVLADFHQQNLKAYFGTHGDIELDLDASGKVRVECKRLFSGERHEQRVTEAADQLSADGGDVTMNFVVVCYTPVFIQTWQHSRTLPDEAGVLEERYTPPFTADLQGFLDKVGAETQSFHTKLVSESLVSGLLLSCQAGGCHGDGSYGINALRERLATPSALRACPIFDRCFG